VVLPCSSSCWCHRFVRLHGSSYPQILRQEDRASPRITKPLVRIHTASKGGQLIQALDHKGSRLGCTANCAPAAYRQLRSCFVPIAKRKTMLALSFCLPYSHAIKAAEGSDVLGCVGRARRPMHCPFPSNSVFLLKELNFANQSPQIDELNHFCCT
jgi:hypothetical protein